MIQSYPGTINAAERSQKPHKSPQEWRNIIEGVLTRKDEKPVFLMPAYSVNPYLFEEVGAKEVIGVDAKSSKGNS